MDLRFKSQLTANYFRQFPLGQPTDRQRRNVPFVFDPSLRSIIRKAGAPCFLPNGLYGWRLAREIEGFDEDDELGGCWPANLWRMVRTNGELGKWEKFDKLRALSQDKKEEAACAKLLLYRRLVDVDEIIESVNCRLDTRVSFEVGSEWYDPPNGEVDFDEKDWKPRGSHSVPINRYEPGSQRFVFQNSWGANWGGHDELGGISGSGSLGCGSISRDLVDSRVVEAWQGFGFGIDLPLETNSGLTELEWKWQPSQRIHVHVREIRDGGERIAWAFCVRREGRLDIDEFYVVPQHRRKGFAHVLVNSVQRLAAKLRCDVRLNLSFADTENDKIWGTKLVARLFNLKIFDSPTRYLHQIGVKNTVAKLSVPAWSCRPERPATVLEYLRPRDEPIIEKPKLFTLYFGTNRGLLADKNQIPFSDKRGAQLVVGEASVCVPKTHRFGSMGRSFIKRWIDWTDDRLKVIRVRPLKLSEFAESAGAFGFDDNDHAKHFLFIHGFNVNFEEACLRTAQLGFDLKVKGHTFLYSWPSAGKTLRYPYDEATVEAALPFFAKFMNQLTRQLGEERIDVIAHSMGNRLLTRWLESKNLNDGPNISGIVFSAPDVDSEVFESRLTCLEENCEQATLYASSGDIAVFFSRVLHRHSRAGFLPPVTCIEGCDTVEVRGLDMFSLGHSYFGDKAALLHDKYVFFHYGIRADQRQRLVETKSKSSSPYWILNLHQ